MPERRVAWQWLLQHTVCWVVGHDWWTGVVHRGRAYKFCDRCGWSEGDPDA